MNGYGFRWREYVPVETRRRRAEAEAKKLVKKGMKVSPVEVRGRTIADSFWGGSWCTNLERYSDFSNRLPRGRTYVRNGSVMHLAVAGRRIEALVSGSEIYTVSVKVAPLPAAKWSAIRRDCSGSVASLVELLQGRLSRGVMERVCVQGKGLFPSPAEIRFDCSCPDWASLCKHVAAVLYGIGARMDREPELLFTLRGVDPKDLVAGAAGGLAAGPAGTAGGRALGTEELGAVFGIEMEEGGGSADGVGKGAAGAAPTPRAAAASRPGKKAPAPPARRPKRKKAARRRPPTSRVEGFTARQLRALETLSVRPAKATRRGKGNRGN